MYREEKIIKCVLHFKTTPNGKWKPMSAKGLTQRIEELKQKNTVLEDKVRGLENQLEETIQVG